MQHAVARSPKVCISAHGIQIPSLLDLGSDVMLLRQSYFEKHLLPKIQVVTGEKDNAHQLFHLTVTNDGQLPVKMYTELDINFLGLKVPNVGILILEDPSQVLDKKHQSKLPGIVGWNLIQLSYNVFVEKYGASWIDSFVCPRELILYCPPSCLCTITQTQIKAVYWECLLNLCPSNQNK